jgi:hypothetical protein
MIRLFVASLVLTLFSTGSHALSLTNYLDLKDRASRDLTVSTTLAAYHTGIVETVQFLLLISPPGKLKVGELYICMSPHLVNEKTVETAISTYARKYVRESGQELSGASPASVALMGLADLSPCD